MGRRLALRTGWTTMDELGCLLGSLFALALGAGLVWALYALVRAHRFVEQAEARLARLEARLGIPASGASLPARGPAGAFSPAEVPPAGGPSVTTQPSALSEPAAGPGEPSASPGAPPSATPPVDAPATSSAPSPEAVPARPPAAPADQRQPSTPPGTAAPPRTATPSANPSANPAATPWHHDLEERLGAKLPVWLGAVALALAGAFLVKYSVDQGWIGPTVRVGLAISFGVVLLAGAGLLRRSARPIAGALAAAGVAVLYAAFLAAVHLYQLITPAGGFALMALTTAVAVGLSLVFGPIVAVIGLVGGLLTPYWIQAGEPDPKRLFAYLLLVHAGVLAVSRRRAWPGLSLASLAGGFLWVFAWLAGAFDPGDGVWLQLFLLLALLTWGATALRPVGGAAPEDEHGVVGEDGDRGLLATASSVVEGPVAVLAAGIGALLAFGVITAVESYGILEWSLLAVLVTGLLVVARLRREQHLLAWLGAATVMVLLLRWAWALSEAAGTVSAEPERFLWTTALLGLLLALGAWLAMWDWEAGGETTSSDAAASDVAASEVADAEPAGADRALDGLVLDGAKPDSAPLRARWGTLCAAVGILHPLIAWLGWRAAFPEDSATFPWSLVAVAVAALYAIAALPVARRRRRPGLEPALAALAVAVTALLSWAAALGFEGEVLTLAWALEVAALAGLARRFRLPVLVRLAAVLAVPVVVRLAFNPWLLEAAEGEPRIFNTILWSHGLAILAFAAAVVLLERKGPDLKGAHLLGAGLRWGIVVLLTGLVALQVHHGFQALSEPVTWRVAALEAGALTVAWLALGLVLLVAARRWPEAAGSAGRLGGRGLVVVALLLALLGPCLLFNPTLDAWEVGATPVFNHLLWIYGVPALLLALAVRVRARRTAADRGLTIAWSLGSLVLLFVLVTLQVLQAFRGSDLSAVAASPGAEGWALSAAWLLLGMVLLAAGIAVGRRFLRAAALGVTAVAVVKVFLFDVARLGDLYRVLSFLGLGLSLLLLAWLYQRFVFRRDGDVPSTADD